MSTEPTTPARPPARSHVLLIVLLIALAATAAATAWVYTWKPQEIPLSEAYRGKIGIVERTQPDSTKLAAGYTDADGDLVADTPKTPTDPEVLVFAAQASVDPTATKATYEPLRAHLEKELGRKVDYLPAAHTHELIDAMKAGKLHVAHFNTGAVPRAVNAAGFVPVCSPATADGKTTYQPLVITPAGGAVKTLADVKGRALACTHVLSHSGYKAQIIRLRDEYKLLPGRDYDIRWTGSHAASIKGVAAKVYEVAGVATNDLDQAKARGEVRDDEVQVIDRGDPRPMDAFGHAHTLPPPLAAKVRAALLSFKWEGTSVGELFRGSGYVKFAPINYKTDWADVRKTDELLSKWDDTMSQ